MLARLVFALVAAASFAAAEVCDSDEISALQVTATPHEPAIFLPPNEADARILRNFVQTAGPYRQELRNYEDIEYTGLIEIGGQVLRGIFDTGSFELLVLSKRCKSPSCSSNKNYFKPGVSKDFAETNWTRVHSFGSGDCKSLLSHDKVKLGPFTYVNQTFWEVTEAEMSILEDASFEAIVGLGDPRQPLREVQGFLGEDTELLKQYQSNGNKVPKWLAQQERSDRQFEGVVARSPTMLQRLGITKFSVCFNPEPKSPGYWIWNDHDPKNFHNFMTVPITGKTSWSAPIHGVTLTGGSMGVDVKMACDPTQKDHKEHACVGLLDSGTSLLSAPSYFLDKMNAKLKELGNDCRNLNRMPDLVFNLNGQEIVFRPDSYIGRMSGKVPAHLQQYFPHLSRASKVEPEKNECTLLMMSMDISSEEGELWIVGMPFFREYYATFNLGDDATYKDVPPQRTVHFAQHDEQCNHPGHSQYAFSKQKHRMGYVRHVDVSKVRVPPWARRAEKRGWVDLQAGEVQAA